MATGWEGGPLYAEDARRMASYHLGRMALGLPNTSNRVRRPILATVTDERRWPMAISTMTAQTSEQAGLSGQPSGLRPGVRRASPNLAMVAVVFTVLKLASICVVSALTSRASL